MISNYTIELIDLAQKLDRCLCVEMSWDRKKFKVSIDHVFVVDNHLRHSVFGLGSTIEDACEDFFRKSRGCELENGFNKIVVAVI